MFAPPGGPHELASRWAPWCSRLWVNAWLAYGQNAPMSLRLRVSPMSLHLRLRLTTLAPPREGDRNAPISQNHNAGRAPPLLRAEGGITNEWQNLPIVHDLRAPDGKRGPSGQDIREMYSLTAFFTPLRIHRKQILPKSADFACISAISCHEGAFFLSGALSEIHRDEILPQLAA